MQPVAQDRAADGALNCWFVNGTTRSEDRVLGVEAASRKLPLNEPGRRLVPDLVIAFTCTPDDRPCVASKRLEMNWNSAIASRL